MHRHRPQPPRSAARNDGRRFDVQQPGMPAAWRGDHTNNPEERGAIVMNKVRALSRGALSCGAASGVLLLASAASAGTASDEARIAKLEAAVAALQAQVQAQAPLAEENTKLKEQVT